MENPEESKLPDPPLERESSKMRFMGIKLKLLLTATFLCAGFLAWGLVSLRVGHSTLGTRRNSNSNNKSLKESPLFPSELLPDNSDVTVTLRTDDDTETKEYVLVVGNCSIPFVPLRGKVWKRNLQNFNFPECTGANAVHSTFNEDSELEVQNLSSFQSCCYREIIRPDVSEIDTYRKSGDCITYTNKTRLSDYEFFLTECNSLVGPPAIKYNFHANVPLKEKVKRKVEFWERQGEKPMSVAVIVLDSVSRSHAFRSLPRTVNLLTRMNFHDFKGHHILGEPTMPNAIPMLLGASSAAEFWKVIKPEWKEQWDNYSFIWKKFAALNYVTMFTEDDPRMGTFNYGGQLGFHAAPTDYYARPLFEAHKEGTFSSMSKEDFCFGNETIPEFTLNYLLRFLNKMKGTPSFSLTWLSRPQHDHMEGLPVLDNHLFNFFRRLYIQRTILESTVVILTGDHGFWDNAYSETHEGLLERRLPMLFIRPPEKLIKKHPEIQINLQNNAHRITSHHDTYQTLVHLSQMASEKVKKRKKVVSTSNEFRRSLFDTIPVTRSCQDANIPAQLCACNLPLPLDDPEAEKNPPAQAGLPPVLPGALPFSY